MIISTSPLGDLYSGLKDYRRLSTDDGFSSKLINVLIFGSGLDLCSLLKLHSIVDQKCKIFGLVFFSSLWCFCFWCRNATCTAWRRARRWRQSWRGSRACSITAPCRRWGAWSSKLTSSTSRRSSEASVTCTTDRYQRLQARNTIHLYCIQISVRARTFRQNPNKHQFVSVVRCRTCGFSCRKRVLQASRPPSTPRTTWSLRTAPTGTRTPAASLLKRSSPSSQVRARGRYYSLNMCTSELDLSLIFTFICAPQVVEGAWPKGKGARCTCTLHISMEATASWAHRWAHLKSLSHLHVSVVKHSLQFQ